MKKIIKGISILTALIMLILPCFALEIKEANIDIKAKSAVLMDANTGTLLYEYNKDDRYAPASVTKIMTLLLVFEAIDSGKLKYTDVLTVSENAASMGGSQIYLEPGETMTVDDLLKSVIIASANDAALTLAEHVAGSEEVFVENMNIRCEELGMKNTHFENVTGLDDDVTDHLTTAFDIALMSRELLKHEKVTEYSTIWMDSVRNGEFGLTNTNRLVRFYRGSTGLKTGSTSKAGFCVSATAKRDDLHLISVIMGSETSDDRNASASKLLDFGFANYSVYNNPSKQYDNISVLGGKKDFVGTKSTEYTTLVKKGDQNEVKIEVEMNKNLTAPIKEGDVVGKIYYKLGNETIGECNIFCSENVEKIDFLTYLFRVLKKSVLK